MFIILGADGQEYGPVTAGKIQEWIMDGRANLQTQARRPDQTGWKPLETFEEFGQAGRHSAPVKSEPPPLAPVILTNPDVVALPLASPWLRLPAAMIDGLLKTLAYLPITIPLVRLVFTEALSGEQKSFHEILQVNTEIVNQHLHEALPLLGTLMLAQFILLAWRGQSVGKLILGLRIVRQKDGSKPSPIQSFLLRGSIPFVIEQIPVIGFLFWVIDSCFIFSPERRCLHDHLAGTVVVKK